MKSRKLIGLEVSRIPDLLSIYPAPGPVTAAWEMLDAVEDAEDLIRRVLRRELLLSARHRLSIRRAEPRFVARTAPPRQVRF
jgi:hypothetical protein